MAVGTKPFTVVDSDQFVDLPENADKLFEFIGGAAIERLPDVYLSAIASQVNFRIMDYLREKGIEGHVTGEAGGYQVSGERYAPDMAFISKQRQPELARTGYNPNPPELAVEVISPTDKADTLLTKVGNYLAAGTTVWIINPDTQTVSVFAPGQKVRTFRAKDTLDGGAILPGFALAVREIFAE